MAKRSKNSSVGKANSQVKTVRAVERAVDILECLAESGRLMSIVEIGREIDLNRPTLYRMLHTLFTKGLIRVSGEPQRYQLDHGVARLAEAWHGSLKLEQLAAPLLTQLSKELDETVALFTLQADRKRCLAEIVSRQALSFSRGTGYTDEIHIGASGHAMLAFSSEEFLTATFASKPVIDTREFRNRLSAIRERGYAVTQNDVIRGAVGIAAPFFSATGQVTGSIGIFGPDIRFSAERVTECADRLKKASAELSSLLGYRIPSSSSDMKDPVGDMEAANSLRSSRQSADKPEKNSSRTSRGAAKTYAPKRAPGRLDRV